MQFSLLSAFTLIFLLIFVSMHYVLFIAAALVLQFGAKKWSFIKTSIDQSGRDVLKKELADAAAAAAEALTANAAAADGKGANSAKGPLTKGGSGTSQRSSPRLSPLKDPTKKGRSDNLSSSDSDDDK